MTGGIYAIICKENGKKYIGQSKNAKNRIENHKSNLRCGRHINKEMQLDFNQYGSDKFSFDIISKIKCNKKRKIAEYNEIILYDNLYNTNIPVTGKMVTIALSNDIISWIRLMKKKGRTKGFAQTINAILYKQMKNDMEAG